jgi:phosphoribosylformimino-5-aminoimidazole carboxamide ribotide isomerase
MIEIIPAIDIIDGKCVRLSQGDFQKKKIYSESPLEIAQEFARAGVKRLHLVDLDGAKVGRVANLQTLESIAGGTDLTIDFGGGLKTDDDLRAVFDSGASFASIGSVAVKDPAKFFGWLEKHGPDKILLGADVREGKIAIDGWQTGTEIELISFLDDYFARGVRQVFCTDISKDGVLQGPATELYRRILARLPDLKLIASGGVSRIDDVEELERVGCSGVIIGKAIYEGKIKLEELEPWLAAGVRPERP